LAHALLTLALAASAPTEKSADAESAATPATSARPALLEAMGIDISGVYSRRTRELTRKCDMMTFVPRRSDFLFSNKSNIIK
jgi:hypothetical protein